MGQRELGAVAHESAEVDEVDVGGARAVADGADASELVLDRMHAPREIVRGESRREDGDLVQELPVGESRRHVHGFGLGHGAGRDETGLRKGGERLERARQMLGARLDVGSERDDRADGSAGAFHLKRVARSSSFDM